MPANRVYLGQKAVQKKSRDEYDTSRDHHAGNIGCAVCAGCSLDLQTGRLEGRGLQRQLRLLPQPLRGPGHQEEITKQGCCTKHGAAALFYGCATETTASVSGALFTAVCSERAALGGVDSDGAQKILQRLLVGGAADVQLL